MIPKNLPILFAAGSEDPVGNFGKGVRKIYEKYRAAGIRDVSLQLYTGDRHEILNESDGNRYMTIYLSGLQDIWKIKCYNRTVIAAKAR